MKASKITLLLSVIFCPLIEALLGIHDCFAPDGLAGGDGKQ